MSGEVHKNHRERMRARFDADSLAGFHDHEALELLLYYAVPQGDVNPTAHRLLEKFGSFHRVLEATPEQLMTVDGVGAHTARMLHLVFEIGRRYCQDSTYCRQKNQELDSTRKIAYYLAPLLAGRSHEVTAVLCVDARLRPICCEFVSEGTVTGSELLGRRIAETAVRNRAPAVILAHNHPRGRACASSADLESTEQLRMSLAGLEIILIDHIILGDGEYVSMRDYGAFD
ncbi:MAG: hypothetical protein IKM54_03710 [Butyricicoccus sp.]|nr:hypothetical protein [Butyricicoccus sp.]